MLSIIHISDLNLTVGHNDVSWGRTWFEMLRDDIAAAARERDASFTFLVVSGDLTLTGSREDFGVADRLLAELCDVSGISKEHLLIVPGNHDLQRPLTQPGSARNFYEFTESFFSREADSEYPLRWYENANTAFLLIDTASQREVSHSQESRIECPSALRHRLIAVCHDRWESTGKTAFPWHMKKWSLDTRTGEAAFLVVLHGHQHDTSSFTRRTEDMKCLFIGSGPLSCEAWRYKSTAPRYHVIEIESGRLSVTARLFAQQSKQWISDPQFSSEFDRSGRTKSFPVWSSRVGVHKQRAVRPGKESGREQLVDRLASFPDEDLRELMTKLVPSIAPYAPIEESKADFAFRLVMYFARQQSLPVLEDAVHSFRDAKRCLSGFLAATRHDSALSMRIIKAAEHLGLKVRQYSEGSSPDENPSESIRHAIAESDVFIVLLSKNAIESDWISKELTWAMTGDFSQRRTIVPIILGRVEVPRTLKGIRAYRLNRNGSNARQLLGEALRSMK